ncbi:MAG: hypothetical protein HOK56_07155 [Deltaproteobacteria bacterium]|jgi:hypothetical protein|nr:hypothetical protein [Deltaproteobacteria bacterium]MBT5486942.1 hypothetical protein [Deltaproteobacteria bacterium]
MYWIILNIDRKLMGKIYFIIITILLSSFLLVSCLKEDDVLYQGVTGKKGFEWKTFGDENTQPKYRGKISDGEPSGLGTHLSPDGKKYEGEWKDDKKHGQGTGTYPNGSKYVGEFKNGVKLSKKLFPGISPLSE